MMKSPSSSKSVGGPISEPAPVVLTWWMRFADLQATIDTGVGNPNNPDLPIVDMDAYEHQRIADLDGEGEIGLADLAQLLSHRGTHVGATHENGDRDGDGDVDRSDLAALLVVYGTSC